MSEVRVEAPRLPSQAKPSLGFGIVVRLLPPVVGLIIRAVVCLDQRWVPHVHGNNERTK
jgi:hypothetical protein